MNTCHIHRWSGRGNCPECEESPVFSLKTLPISQALDALSPTATGTEAEVCKDIAERQQRGIAKYNTTVRDNPLALRQWLQHAYEECLDQAIYLKRAMEEIDRG